MHDLDQQEQQRLSLQAQLDGEKPQSTRNRLGQFATPTVLATEILEYAKSALPRALDLRFLDPAIGTGSFYSALLRVFGVKTASNAVGYEIDEHYALPARELWKESKLDLRIEDFTRANPPINEGDKATLVICNPPYVRHHHLQSVEKRRLHDCVRVRHGIALSGLAGLYCYFLCLSKGWMARGGFAAWLIPAEFMDVNYGKGLREFLLDKVTLLHIHRFAPQDVQFGDALVSSAVVCFRNEPPSRTHKTRVSFGGSLRRPHREISLPITTLRSLAKWSHSTDITYPKEAGNSHPVLGDFFQIKRGIATGANEYFVMTETEAQDRGIPERFLRPILPSPRYLSSDLIDSNANGNPCLEKAVFLFSSDLPEDQLLQEYPGLLRYLQDGHERGISGRYICRNRHPWYSQETRAATPFLCTYMGRLRDNAELRPFRFILNRSRAIAANVYLMLYPKAWVTQRLREDPQLDGQVWRALQAIPVERLVREGRVYGGGLHKLEPKELLNAPAVGLATLLSYDENSGVAQPSLFVNF